MSPRSALAPPCSGQSCSSHPTLRPGPYPTWCSHPATKILVLRASPKPVLSFIRSNSLSELLPEMWRPRLTPTLACGSCFSFSSGLQRERSFLTHITVVALWMSPQHTRARRFLSQRCSKRKRAHLRHDDHGRSKIVESGPRVILIHSTGIEQEHSTPHHWAGCTGCRYALGIYHGGMGRCYRKHTHTQLSTVT